MQWVTFFSFCLQKLQHVCLLSLDFSSAETINTVNESINTVCYTSPGATAMMHCSVNCPCSRAVDGGMGSLSADRSLTRGTLVPTAARSNFNQRKSCTALFYGHWTPNRTVPELQLLLFSGFTYIRAPNPRLLKHHFLQSLIRIIARHANHTFENAL